MKLKFFLLLPLLVFFLSASIFSSVSSGRLISDKYASQDTAPSIKVFPVKEKIEVKNGDTGTILIKIDIPEKSYIYGNPKGPGVGRPTTVDISCPGNFIFDAVKFDPPDKHVAKGDPNYVWVYRNSTSVQLAFKTRNESRNGVYIISITVKALLCTDKACTPQEFTIDYPVHIVSDLHANTGTADTAVPFSEKKDGLSANENENTIKTDYETGTFRPAYLSTKNISNIIQAIFYGLIAGFILNFMPCVLPVISIKILDLIKYSGGDRKETRKIGIMFAAGILSAFSVLASLAAFLGYSWGGLFKSNVFLIAMIAVIFALSLSMFELFTLNIPGFAGKSHDLANKYANSYTKGLLATFLATPCSGPFLGGTLAWAFIQPPAVIFLIFISVGLGMSLPYLILTANPGLMKFIPKPGKWMTSFENIMGMLLLGTVVYFIGILQSNLIMPTLWFLLFIGIAFWQFGRYGSLDKPKRQRIISRTAIIIIIAAGYFISYDFLYKGEEITGIPKNTFSISKLFENKSTEKITMIDFTADWCPNCKLVEKTSLYTKKVKNALNQYNIDLMVADLTRENPEAEKLLSQLGSRSIPFLAVFPYGKSFFEPVCLRDIYSEKDVLEAISIVLKSSKAPARRTGQQTSQK